MEELFKERKEKLNIIKNLLRKPKEEKKATNNTSNIPEWLIYQMSGMWAMIFDVKMCRKTFMFVQAVDTILKSLQQTAFKCWWIKTVFEKSPPDWKRKMY